ncbi:hypothetical protein BSF41_10750 [Flavobacterium sp. ACN2]|jgi:hypothetical protein|uniref:hypothetical protein n=1 Tax=unclassified Flavobacterium TaxID=196869 RepID=UPI000BB3A4C9|nr:MULTISPECIES: hypothetical protein [unclassified Flavobacterium]MDY0990196.1 hypothetical protein [Flavobacterium sp. CFBP9031]PBI92591.1 hypothetical protein BSF41_10750 [Flavobacterium sp. ACN2]
MKKTALTFGLFSLVIVATSFANPTASARPSETLSIITPIDGGQKTTPDRKRDSFQPIDGGQKTVPDRKSDFANIGGVNSDSQLSTLNRKLD